MKRIISFLTLLCMLFSLCTGVYASDEPSIVSYAGNTLNNGISQVFLFKNITPETVTVNDTVITLNDDYNINVSQGKLYIHGDVFAEKGDYNVAVKNGDVTADCSFTLKDGTETVQYTIDDDYTYGTGINPTETAGIEHSSGRDRKPVIVRSINKNSVGEYWIQWDITNSGKYTIDYWCPRSGVNCAVDVEVADKNGTRTFSGLITEDSANPQYVSLVNKTNSKPCVFDFSGNGEYYLKVSPTPSGGGGSNFVVDSFKMTSYTEADNTDTPKLTSKVYEVSANTVNGCLFNTTPEAFVNNIEIPADCIYDFSNLENGYITGNTKITIKKIFDENIRNEYTLGEICYISSLIYDINNSSKKISGIPYGESVQNFADNIIHNELVEIKIFDNETEITTGNLQSGYTLKIYLDEVLTDTYTLEVTEASRDNVVSSDVYKVSGSTIEVSYAETVGKIFSNISVPKFARIEQPYEKDTSKIITKDFKFKCIAQNGDEKEYEIKVIVKESDKETELQSSVYNISISSVGVIPNNTSTDSFKKNVSATNGGTVQVLDKNMKEKTSGNIEAGDTIRVYPRYRSAENKYRDYGVLVEPDYRKIAEPQVVWACENNENNSASNLRFLHNGFRDGNGFSTKRIGYNATNAHVATNPKFQYTALKNEIIKPEFYLTANSEGELTSYDVKIVKNGTEIAAKSVSASVSQLVDLGIYKLEANDVLSVEPTAVNITNTFVSATTFTEYDEYSVNIQNVYLNSDNYCTFDLKANFETDVQNVKSGLKIVSENGNVMPFEVVKNSDIFTINTLYPLERGVRYYTLSDITGTAGDKQSRAEMLPLVAVAEKNYVTVRLDKDNSSLNVTTELSLENDGEITINIVLLKDKTLVLSKVYRETVSGQKDTITKTVESTADYDKAVVYVTDASGGLIADTYYAY